MSNPTPNEVAKWLEDYFAMADEIKAHEAMQDDLRRVIEAYVSEHGSIKVDHVGSAAITPASTSQSYDKAGINHALSRVIMLSAQAQSDGDLHTFRVLAEIAQIINDARKETTRKATLRITASK
jgi:hypothetical protein